MLARSYERGDIYFKDYEGLYCVGCERFYTEKELLPGDVCPTHNRPVELIKEGNYFLHRQVSRAGARSIRRNPDFIRPERYRNEALNMLSEPLERPVHLASQSAAGLGDRAALRHQIRDLRLVRRVLGVRERVPTTDRPALHEIWPRDRALHRQGHPEDSRRVLAADAADGGPAAVPPSQRSWMAQFRRLADVEKLGQHARSGEYEKDYGPDVLRYFVMREMVYGLDGDFSEERLIERYNADLANDLGNFASRVLSMAHRYFGSEMKLAPGDRDG